VKTELRGEMPHLGADEKRAALRLLAVGGAATLLYCTLGRKRRTFPGLAAGSPEERDRLAAVLAELNRRFFHICMDVASVSKSVRQKLAVGKVDMPEEQLREQLARQCQVFQKLGQVQSDVTTSFECSPEEVEELQRQHGADEEIAEYGQGFTSMLTDALGGVMPVLPNVKIPAALTQEKVLEILKEVHALETKAVLDKLGGRRVSVKDLGEVLSGAHREAWEQALESHALEVAGGREVYHSTLALYMRDAEFAHHRKVLDDAHQQQMVQLFKPEAK